ncbi:VacB-like exoribonuclease II [Metamycoplasma cloacale]|uniref:Ribonuclease R n=1 Tax=Metamycoplasma cloacale TaxID=92401 RepID=A0A2Z4LM50_9BACT|nr:ribonuclease R [Metamycoplasma cloacale]AWX42819.1 ribonuclease R [Metamycoplasma cloacale]VEU79362.1 VacB-like exoribonuclease II [Metamycoplasma cloacale]
MDKKLKYTFNLNEMKLLEFLKEKNQATFLEIAKVFKINRIDNNKLTNLLNKLLNEFKIDKFKDNYRLINFVTDLKTNISVTSKRFGFVDFQDQNGNNLSAFIPSFQLNGILDKDLLDVSIYSYKNEHNEVMYKANIKANLEHPFKYITGFIQYGKNRQPYFKPYDEKMNGKFIILNDKSVPKDLKETDIVKCEVLKPNLESIVLMYKDVIANIEDKNHSMYKLFATYDVNETFDIDVLTEASSIPQFVSEKEISERKDLRKLLTVTIDGLDTKDFDDAISCYKLDNGNYKLFIHIADVSYYVKEGSPIDKEALKRGTSIYLPDRVIPMLPFELSNGICSLNPNVDRCCLTLELEIDSFGNNKTYDIYPSVITSDYRLTYNGVNDFLEHKLDVPNEIAELLLNAQSLASILRAKKINEGYVDFEIEEPKIIMKDGNVVDIVIKKEGISEKMIEDFMVRANETVAEMMQDKKLPSIYRIHDKPDDEKLMNLQNLLSFVGLKHLKVPFDGNPKSFELLVEKIKETKFDDYIKMSLLRTMQKASYSSNNIGHFGLASQAYSHFTSPIRRYPDLLLHRLIRNYIFQKQYDPLKEKEYIEEISNISLLNSEAEKNAMTIERDIVDIKKSEFFQQFINKTFKATIVSIEKFGIFFNIEEYQASVLIRFEDLNDEVLKISNFEAKGLTHYFAIGQTRDIKITSVDLLKGNINAIIA